jgi:uncharacterized protein YbdZ (MbtH family)
MRISEGKLHRVNSVKATGEHAVRVRFENSKTFSIDLKALVHHSKGLKSLRDPAAFARVTLGEGGHSIEWPGDLDIGADTVWELALEQAGRADAVEFVRWRWKHGLSLSTAA